MAQLWSVTCHMGSHSVTCYPTQVNAPRLTPAMQAGTRRDGRLSWPSWLDSAPAGSRTSNLSITSPTPNHCTTKTKVSALSIINKFNLYWVTNASYSDVGTIDSIAWWMLSWICWNCTLDQFVTDAYSNSSCLLHHNAPPHVKQLNDIQSGPKKQYPFYFCDNFRKCSTILTTFSPLQQEIYNT